MKMLHKMRCSANHPRKFYLFICLSIRYIWHLLSNICNDLGSLRQEKPEIVTAWSHIFVQDGEFRNEPKLRSPALVAEKVKPLATQSLSARCGGFNVPEMPGGLLSTPADVLWIALPLLSIPPRPRHNKHGRSVGIFYSNAAMRLGWYC